jgi:Calx-beta domain-containing protein/hemolysin type calcium-binding protein
MRANRACAAVLAVVALLAVVGSAAAKTVNGTARNDVLRGTSKADKLNGKAGNDKLYGLGGNDVLVGGAGNDTLVGGPGRDKLLCGGGSHDVAVADAGDTVSATCETVQGPVLSSVAVGDASVTEGNSGTTKLSFAVTLSKPVTWNVSVAYATADGSAKAGSDYAAANGAVTFAPGETSKSVDVAVNGDTAVENDETLSVALSNPVNVTIGRGTATGTIKNDDHPNARPGHYAGTTSQNRPISFDVAADGTSLTNLVLTVDVDCFGSNFTDLPFDFGTSKIPIKPDGTFSVEGHGSDSGVSLDFSVGGSFGGGSAKGTARADFHVGGELCSTGDITWSAD